MLSRTDRFLNSITMYRLLLNGLFLLAGIAMIHALAGKIPFGVLPYVESFFILLVVSHFANSAFAQLSGAQINVESAYITGLILFFVMAPPVSQSDFGMLAFVAVVAMGSKYIFAIRKKHIFNPAAIALVCLGLLGSGNATWWVGSTWLFPYVAIFGMLIVRKLRRGALLDSFLATSVVVAFALQFGSVGHTVPELYDLFGRILVSSPLLFLGGVMLTEPLTTPPTKELQVMYGALVGLFASLPFHVGTLYSTPELALVIGNIFSYIVSPKEKLFLVLREKKEIAKGIFEYVFRPSQPFPFKAGQYLEWTLSHSNPDSRGVRRYFTIASSPTEKELRLGVKMNTPASSFKKQLAKMDAGDKIVAHQLAGEFVLPLYENQKLVFIGGGIGVTPFRSQIKYLLDTDSKRKVTLFYCVQSAEEIAYRELFDEAERRGALKVVYVLTRPDQTPVGVDGRVGFITEEMIREMVPDFASRKFYLSGPSAMVESYESLLRSMGIPRSKIVRDYFPGF